MSKPQAQHTPGPWHINPLFDYSVNSEKKHVTMVNVSVRGKECDVDHPEAQANARLIAAAPDLLEACKLAKQHLDAMRLESGMGNVLLPFEKAAFEQVDTALTAAIEKAEGDK